MMVAEVVIFLAALLCLVDAIRISRKSERDVLDKIAMVCGFALPVPAIVLLVGAVVGGG